MNSCRWSLTKNRQPGSELSVLKASEDQMMKWFQGGPPYFQIRFNSVTKQMKLLLIFFFFLQGHKQTVRKWIFNRIGPPGGLWEETEQTVSVNLSEYLQRKKPLGSFCHAVVFLKRLFQATSEKHKLWRKRKRRFRPVRGPVEGSSSEIQQRDPAASSVSDGLSSTRTQNAELNCGVSRFAAVGHRRTATSGSLWLLWRLSPLIRPFLPTAHTTHTHLWVPTCLNSVPPQFWFDLFFSLSHLISTPPSLSVRTGKKQGPPENRNKGNPPFIHLSISVPPSSLLLIPPPPPPPSSRRGASSPSLYLSLSLSLSAVWSGGGGVFSPCFTYGGVQISPCSSLAANQCAQFPW